MSDPETIKKLEEINGGVKALSGKLNDIFWILTMIASHFMLNVGSLESAVMTPKENEKTEEEKKHHE